MAEEFVSKDQFNEFVKRMEQGFHHADQRHTELMAVMNQRFDQVNQQMTLDREAMLLRFEQADRQRAEDRQAMMEQFQQVDRQFGRHETRLLSLENWMRTTYVTLAIVVVGVAAQLFYTLLRFGFKPTP